MPHSPTSKIVAPGRAAITGECVAHRTWEPDPASLFSTPTTARLLENDSADSGSSRQWNPCLVKRLSMRLRKLSPWLI